MGEQCWFPSRPVPGRPLARRLLGLARRAAQRRLATLPGRRRAVARDPGEGEQTSAEAVAGLRAVAARYPDDPGVERLIAELKARSPRFSALWAEGRVAERRSSRKTVHHPELGRIVLDCDSLHLPDRDQRLIVYSAEPGTPEADALALLRVVGLQRLAR